MPKLNQIRLKICGLRDNINEVVALQPHYAGFIFYPGSPRYVGDHLKIDQLRMVPSPVAKVGVFVNQSMGEVFSTVKEYGLQYVQLHGNETLGYCKGLHAEGVRIIKAFAGNGQHDKNMLNQYGPFIDFYLFDTQMEKFGGTGKSFDWNNLRSLDLPKPIILSGGVDLENVENIELLEGIDVCAIDVNSRFEERPGLKNIALLKSLKDKMRLIPN